MTTPPRGPRCSACGCTRVEHEEHIDESWHRVAGRCLSCECEEFVGDKTERTVEAVDAH